MSRITARLGLLLAASAALGCAVLACESEDAPPAVTTTDAGAGDASAPPSPPPLFDAGDDAGPIACGAATCAAASYDGLVSLPACCTSDQRCGLDLRPAAMFAAVPETCTSRQNEGFADDACPSYERALDASSGARLEGCCRADKTCGVFLRLTDELDLGCVHADGLVDDAGAPEACGQGDAG